MRHRTTRTYVLVAAVIALSTLAGCSALGLGSSCGPGDAEIGDLEPDTGQVTIQGEVTATDRGSYLVDDGTGQAFIMSGEHDVSEGDCVTVNGRTHTGGMGTETDITIVPNNATDA